jgi:hypothetical protein
VRTGTKIQSLRGIETKGSLVKTKTLLFKLLKWKMSIEAQGYKPEEDSRSENKPGQLPSGKLDKIMVLALF